MPGELVHVCFRVEPLRGFGRLISMSFRFQLLQSPVPHGAPHNYACMTVVGSGASCRLHFFHEP